MHHPDVLVLSRSDVEALLDLDALVDALGSAMAELSAGAASVPPRVAALVERAGGLLAAMPAFLPGADVLEAKLVSLFPGNAGTVLPTHQAVLVCFDPSTGSPTALMDAEYITEVRTAAGSALSARLLAREDAGVLAVLGTGVQARAHARAIPRVRRIEQIRLAGRDAAKVSAFAEGLSETVAVPVRACSSPEEAMDGADIVAACTHSPEPVVRRGAVRSGMHISSVGINPNGPEVEPEVVRDSLVVVESRTAVLAPFPAGSVDIVWPIRDGLFGEDHIHAEIGELVSGTRPGRTSADQMTLYKSVGVGVQDAAAARLVLDAARTQGVGVEVEL
jgi:ornithine cyclodeaminase